MLLRRRLVAAAAVPERVPLDDARLLEPLHGPVDGRERHAVVARRDAPVQLRDVGVVVRLRQDAGDQPALPGEPQAHRTALLFKRARGPGRRLAHGPGDYRTDGHGRSLFSSMPRPQAKATSARSLRFRSTIVAAISAASATSHLGATSSPILALLAVNITSGITANESWRLRI